jgi:hypothetical protein
MPKLSIDPLMAQCRDSFFWFCALCDLRGEKKPQRARRAQRIEAVIDLGAGVLG